MWLQTYLRFASRLFSINDAGEVRLNEDQKSVFEGRYDLFVIVRDNGEPPRQDSAIIVINADGGHVATVVEQEMDMVAIILLSVLCGCLVLIVVILVIYIYKK